VVGLRLPKQKFGVCEFDFDPKQHAWVKQQPIHEANLIVILLDVEMKLKLIRLLINHMINEGM
jgi:hypothetical protein